MQNPNLPKETVVVRAAIVGKGDSIFAVQRAEGKRASTSGVWELPGGTVDDTDPDYVAALQREVKEETGLDIVPISGFSLYNTYPMDGDRTGETYRAFVCRAIVTGGNFQLSNEHTAAAHFSPADMMQSSDFRSDTPLALRQIL